jgi:hypothetical protein
MPPGSITLAPHEGRGPLIWVRDVGGGELHGLSPLDDKADDAEVHRRVGGYWQMGSIRGLAIQGALAQGRRVFVLGKIGDRVARIVEVSPEPYLVVAAVEETGAGTAKVLPDQPSFLGWPGRRGERWGTMFDIADIERSPRRCRLHTATVDDSAWSERVLQTARAWGQNPGLFTTDERLPLRLSE